LDGLSQSGLVASIREANVSFTNEVGRDWLYRLAADPEVARGWLDTLTCLALPAEVMQRAGMQERVAAFAGRTPDPMPGPTRPDLLAAVAGS